MRLTYFQPSTFAQMLHEMSATTCMPVMSTLSSLGPSCVLTLHAHKGGGVGEGGGHSRG